MKVLVPRKPVQNRYKRYTALSSLKPVLLENQHQIINPSVSFLVSQIDETTLLNKLAAFNDQRNPLHPLIPFALLENPIQTL